MTLWTQLLARACSHRFSWPRVHADGRHYQICLLCGTAYEYDWEMMCLTDRLILVNGSHVSQSATRSAPPPSTK